MAETSALDSDLHHLDVRGLACPLPFLLARKRLRLMAAGATLTVSASDATAREDLAALCEAGGHVLLEDGHKDGIYSLRICKGDGLT